MLKTIENHIKDKSVAVLGFGREGRATLPWVLKADCASRIAIVDKNPVTLPEELKDCSKEIEIITGDDYQKCLNDFDVIFKSPGIVLEEEKEFYTCEILSEMDIFFERFKNQIIGITGTKGKTTTTFYTKSILDCYTEGQGKGKNGMLTGEYVFDGKVQEEAGLTTPEVFDLHRHLARCCENGCEYLVMETSSQALKYGRTDQCGAV